MFIIAANWKMNGSADFAKSYSAALDKFINAEHISHEVIILPPAPLLTMLKGNFKIGGQNCYAAEKGAFTGEISPYLLKDLGCEYVMLGHSERRAMGETSEMVAAKAETAHKAGLKTIICAGEHEGEDFTSIVFSQLAKSLPHSADKTNTIIAYEPVWAIGTGKTPGYQEIADRHGMINETHSFKTLYGGSVSAENALAILGQKNIGGLLVGGASLDVEAFKKIISVK